MLKAVVGPVLLSLSFAWNYGTVKLVDDTVPAAVQVFKPTVTAVKDGKVSERFTYRKEFDSLKGCQDWVFTGGDDDFKANTAKLLNVLKDRGEDEAHLTCEEQKPKDTI